jgi:alkylated DNA repair protein (DNA oxidative demethylase)
MERSVTKASLPEGFRYLPEFLTEAEEWRLLEVISGMQFREFAMKGVTAKRRIVQFGWHYSFESYRLTPSDPAPSEFDEVRIRVASVAGVEPDAFSEILVTEYTLGAGIGWHRDAPPFGIVAGVSLAGTCRMRFRTVDAADRRAVAVQLSPRSLYLLTGSARTDWQHTIPPTKELRYSITFRTLRPSRRPAAPGPVVQRTGFRNGPKPDGRR